MFCVFYRAIAVRRHWASFSGALQILIDWSSDWADTRTAKL